MTWNDYLKETRDNAERYLIERWGVGLPDKSRAHTPLALTTISDIMLKLSMAESVTGMSIKTFTHDAAKAAENIKDVPWVHYCHLAGVSDKELQSYTPELIDCTLRNLAILFIDVPGLIKELVIAQKIK